MTTTADSRSGGARVVVKVLRIGAVSVLVGTAVALVLGTSCGASAAMSTAASGTLTGEAQFDRHRAHGEIEVFNSAGHLVRHHYVSYQWNQFRFVLTPGRYKVTLKMNKQWMFHGCPYSGHLRVRANRTAWIGIAEGCVKTSTY